MISATVLPHTGAIGLGKPRHRWEDNIRMDLNEIGINVRNWVYSAQDRDCWKSFVNGIKPLGFKSHGVSTSTSSLINKEEECKQTRV